MEKIVEKISKDIIFYGKLIKPLDDELIQICDSFDFLCFQFEDLVLELDNLDDDFIDDEEQWPSRLFDALNQISEQMSEPIYDHIDDIKCIVSHLKDMKKFYE